MFKTFASLLFILAWAAPSVAAPTKSRKPADFGDWGFNQDPPVPANCPTAYGKNGWVPRLVLRSAQTPVEDSKGATFRAQAIVESITREDALGCKSIKFSFAIKKVAPNSNALAGLEQMSRYQLALSVERADDLSHLRAGDAVVIQQDMNQVVIRQGN